MDVLGTPSEDFMSKISSESVSKFEHYVSLKTELKFSFVLCRPETTYDRCQWPSERVSVKFSAERIHCPSICWSECLNWIQIIEFRQKKPYLIRELICMSLKWLWIITIVVLFSINRYLEKYADPNDEPVSPLYDQSFEDMDLPVEKWKGKLHTSYFNFFYFFFYLLNSFSSINDSSCVFFSKLK